MDRVPSEPTAPAGRTALTAIVRPATPALLVLAAVAALGAAACDRSGAPAAVLEDPRPAFGGDFTLTNQDNQRFRLEDVRGRPVLLFFGYTSCPDMCPMTMSRIAGALQRV